MNTFYSLMWFDPTQKRLYCIERETEKEIYEEMICLMQSIPHPPHRERIDYDWDERCQLGRNEHNGWLEDEQNQEWFFTTNCFRY